MILNTRIYVYKCLKFLNYTKTQGEKITIQLQINLGNNKNKVREKSIFQNHTKISVMNGQNGVNHP